MMGFNFQWKLRAFDCGVESSGPSSARKSHKALPKQRNLRTFQTLQQDEQLSIFYNFTPMFGPKDCCPESGTLPDARFVCVWFSASKA